MTSPLSYILVQYFLSILIKKNSYFMGNIIQEIKTCICLDDLSNCTGSFPVFNRGLLMQSTLFPNSREVRGCSLKLLTSIYQ